MFVSQQITVTPGISASAPIITTIKLCKGTLKRVIFRPAPGPNWEVYGKLLYREFHLFPRDTSEWLALEAIPILIEPDWNDWDGLYAVDIWCCSPTARYTHNIQIELEVQETPTLAELFHNFIQMGFKWQNQ